MRLRLPDGTLVEAEPPAELPPGVEAVRDGNAVWVFSGGETYRIERAVPRPGAKEAEADHDLRAPMPGKVVKIVAADGDPVVRNQPLLLLEAMKMEHEIRAPRAGTLRLFCKEGQMVGLSDVLAEVD